MKCQQQAGRDVLLRLRFASFPLPPIGGVFVRVRSLLRRPQLPSLRRYSLCERFPHDVVDALGARELRLQARHLAFKLRDAPIKPWRRRNSVVFHGRTRSGLDEELPIAEQLFSRVRRDGLVRGLFVII